MPQLNTYPVFLLLILFFSFHLNAQIEVQPSESDLIFTDLSETWDNGIPLGNGMLGALIWKKDGKLRISLDRADLWDLRPMANLETEKWKFSWVYEKWKSNNYNEVQNAFDVPYDKSPAPSKIPGAALEIDIASLGEIKSVKLFLNNALCEITWYNGVKFYAFVHATEPTGWYYFKGVEEELAANLEQPLYNAESNSEDLGPVTGLDLRRLAYEQGTKLTEDNIEIYRQKGWGGFEYEVATSQKVYEDGLIGRWSISYSFPEWKTQKSAKEIITVSKEENIENAYSNHLEWWQDFWSKSSINVPNKILNKQWHLEQYKFGSVARADTPPISLQAIWTADNGKLPPWKGDFHHDLNTQLSYWPSYTANHLDLEEGFINWLWKNKEIFKAYTKNYFDSPGLNVPGVSTLTGEPMGGWIQYSFGPTVSAWLAQHFYWHYKYSMDSDFLSNKAYPWFKETALFLEAISVKQENGTRKLPISSSPEIHDNTRDAWFKETTNYDLALIHYVYEKAEELAQDLDLKEDAKKWNALKKSWPKLAIDQQIGLLVAPNIPLETSHRHFSHLMAIHPLGLLDVSNGEKDKKVINNTLEFLEKKGSSQWTGYSFSWLGNLNARALDGDSAEKALEIFATAFCLPNSFHVNGDQSGKGHSTFTYRPFTLEGNFAFASGLQEMLIQSHTDTITIFPAIPEDWKNISFKNLRAQGAFLVTAEMVNGTINKIKIKSLKGAPLKILNPFDRANFKCSKKYKLNKHNIISIETLKDEEIVLTP